MYDIELIYTVIVRILSRNKIITRNIIIVPIIMIICEVEIKMVNDRQSKEK